MIDLNNVLKNSASLEVHAHWDPIADATYNLHKNSPENTELFDLSPNEPTREYKRDAFNAFLPSSGVTSLHTAGLLALSGIVNISCLE